MLPSSQPPANPADRALPVGPILIMVAKGMKPREIAEVFPEFSLDEIRSAVLQAAELLKDPEASLTSPALPVQTILEKARRNADLAEDEAMDQAVALTRAYRRERVGR